MRFWDTSAIVPLILYESASNAVSALLQTDEAMIVWWGTRVECVSAFARVAREGRTPMEEHASPADDLKDLSLGWSEISPNASLRSLAERAVHIHSLKAADAFQLAAALTWTRGDPTLRAFVSLDERLRRAASREGFDVLPSDPNRSTVPQKSG